MSFRHLAIVALTVSLLPAGPLTAQEAEGADSLVPDTTTVVTIELQDGSTLTGYVLTVTPTALTIRTLGGAELTLRRQDIVRVRRPRGTVRDATFWPSDPSDSRLFLGPTARVPGHRHGYIGVYELFIVSGAAGVGSRGMLSFGVSLFPGIEVSEQVFYLAPKLQVVDSRYIQLAGGAFWVRPPDGEESGGLAFGTISAGDERAALTATLGFPFVTGTGFADDELLMLGAELRATPRVKLITENWFAPGEDGAILSGGVRLILDGATIEAAAATTTEGGFLPVVNFSLTW